MTRSQHIQSVFEKYGTDKAEHGYAEFYAQHLPENPRSILEIGVKQGNSIRAWAELFPDAKIFGLDLFDEFPVPGVTASNVGRITFTRGNQCDWRLLEDLRNLHFEVIIDDGSHNWRDQMITFYGLMHEGCSYFIEDLQTNMPYEKEYSQGLPTMFNAKEFSPKKEPYQGALYRLEEGKLMSGIKLIKC